MDSRFRLKRVRLWRLIPLLLHWVCIVYLLAILPVKETMAFVEREGANPDLWSRDEICAAAWLTMSYPISLCKKDDEEINPHDMPPDTEAWGYLRFSPGDNQSLEDQEAAVTRFAKEKGWILTRVFKDEGVSGKSTKNREQFEYMIHLARQNPRPADLLIIWSFSRFARNQDHSQFYRADLRMHGWQILSMMDDIPTGSLGRIYEALLDWKNEQFLIDLSADTIRGLHYVVDKGCLPGGKVCKGYTCRQMQIGTRRDGKSHMGRKPEIDPNVEPLVIRAFEMKAQGAPYAAISQQTGLYSPTSGSWNHFFRNRVYIGEYEFQGEVVTHIYPAIISKELFQAVQKRLPKRRKKMRGRHHPRRKGSSFFLANIGRCAYCGGGLEGKRVQKYRYYVCARHNEQADLCPESGLIPADELEERVLSALINHVLTVEHMQGLLDWTNKHLNSGLDELKLRIEKTRKELAEAEHLLRKMALNFGTMETPSRVVAQLLTEQESKVEGLRVELSMLKEEWANSRIEVSQEEIELYVNRERTMIDRAEFFDLREVCEQLCSAIVMSQEECKVELHFPSL